jgi:hypothetical protein
MLLLFVSIFVIVCSFPLLAFLVAKLYSKKDRKPECCVECKYWVFKSNHNGNCKLNGRDVPTEDKGKCLFEK